jgi:DNA-binding NtrC family response regulator
VLAGNGQEGGAQVRDILLGAGTYAVCSEVAPAVPPDLVIPILTQRQDPLSVLADLRARLPGTPLLPVLDQTHLSGALDRLVPGVTDFLVAPPRAAELLARLRRVLPRNGTQEIHQVCRRLAEAAGLDRLRGTDPAFEKLKRQILMAAKADVTVLVTGETGTGKELTAHALHYLSDRAVKPFLAVNCGAIPGDLFENELFGHQRGAFTDARSHQQGLVAEAEGGTLFLDEIDALTPSTQVKILRFLEDHSYRPLGTSRSIMSDVRLVAATNTDLRQRVREGAFREDLFYRLHVVALHLPPLRERVGDIALLAEHFLQQYGKYDDRWRFAPEALEALRGHDWPGNVRELENLVRHVVAMNPPKAIRADDLPPPIRPGREEHGDGSLRAAKARAIAHFEQSYLEGLLRAHRGNVSQAARAARQDRRTFRRLLQKYGLNASMWTPH